MIYALLIHHGIYNMGETDLLYCRTRNYSFYMQRQNIRHKLNFLNRIKTQILYIYNGYYDDTISS